MSKEICKRYWWYGTQDKLKRMLFCVLLRYRLYLEGLRYIILAPASKLCAKGTSKGPCFFSIAHYDNTPSILSTIHLILKTLSFLQMRGMLARQSRTFTRRMQRNLSRGAAYSRICSFNWKLMPVVLDLLRFHLIINVKTSILQLLSPFLHHHNAWLTDFCGYTERFIMFSVITNIYNEKPKGPTLFELFTTTGKTEKVFFFFYN